MKSIENQFQVLTNFFFDVDKYTVRTWRSLNIDLKQALANVIPQPIDFWAISRQRTIQPKTYDSITGKLWLQE